MSYGNIKKYTGEIDRTLLAWLEKNDYDESELLTNGRELFVKNGRDFILVDLESVAV